MIDVFLPIPLKSRANMRQHWGQRQRMAKQQRNGAHRLMRALVGGPPPAPLVITMTRVGARRLDSDNVATACKSCRDGIADWLGIDDGSPLLEWQYDQAVGAPHGVRVRIEEVQP